jgi:ankyrin repeat protein
VFRRLLFLSVFTKHENSLNSTYKGGRNPLQVACTWGQTYPLLNTRLCDEDETYSIDDKLGDSVGQENEIYQKIIGYLLEKCDHKKKDELFQIDSLAYADLTLCLFPLIQLSKREDLNFDSFHNFKDVCSVLFYALKFDHAHVVDLIKDVPLIKTERRSLSLLHLCSNYNSRQFLRKLLSIDKYQQVINSEDIYNVTATSIACRKGRDEMLKILIDAGADITNSSQLIEIACKNGHHKVVELLLKSLSNLKSGSLSGSLQTACLNGFDKIVHLLVDRGANVDTSNRHGTPLYIACQYGHEKTVEILLKSKADANKSNKFGSTPLHIACQTKRTNIVKLLLGCTTTEINSVEKKGFAPLHAACKNGCEDIVELLIAAGVEVNLRGTKDVTPLWNACRFGYDRVVKRLVDAGADVNVVGHNGYSLLHLACQENHKNVVDLLVKAGVKVNEVNNEDMTPLQIAQEKGFQEIVEVLELRGSGRI